MDTSEKYIKMCEKAQEIQGFREKGGVNGDIFYLIFDAVKNTFKVKKYKEYADFKIGDVTESGAKCISFNEETQMLEFEYLSKEKEDQIFVFSDDNGNKYLHENCLYSYYLSDVEYEYEVKKIWLPRQDQLQEMVEGTFSEKLSNIFQFLYPPVIKIEKRLSDEELDDFKDDFKRLMFNSQCLVLDSKHCEVEFMELNQFQSFEQLWLAFVMKEKYNKIWNEEKQDWYNYDNSGNNL